MEVQGKRTESDMDDKSTGVDEFCKPCEILDKVKTKAIGKCAQCEDHMCRTCFRHHLRGKQYRNHVLLDINGTPVSVDKGDENEEKCEKHGDVVKFFCRAHDFVGCGECAVLEHSSCKLEYIKDVSKGFKDGQDFRHLSKKVDQLESTSLENDKKVQTYREDCKVIHEDALKEIQKFRVGFNKYLDKAEADINTEAEHLKHDNDTHLDNLKQESEQLSLEIDNLNLKLNTKLLPENKLFINAVNSKPVVQQIEQGVAMVQTRSKIKKYKFVPDEQLLEILTSARKFGYIEDISEQKDAELKELEAWAS